MGRKPDGAAARTRQVMVRLSDDGLAETDRLRDRMGLSRAAYFRHLLAQDSKRHPK